MQIKARQAKNENTCAMVSVSKPGQAQEPSKTPMYALKSVFFNHYISVHNLKENTAVEIFFYYFYLFRLCDVRSYISLETY